MATTDSRSTFLSDVMRELDPSAPPAAPPDLLSTVSSLFVQRQEKLRKEELRKEELARKDAETEARFAAASAATRKIQAEAEGLTEALVPSPRITNDYRSTEEIEDLIDDQIAKEAKGPGLRRARHETEQEYEARMDLLECRVNELYAIDLKRRQTEPVHYVDGFPVNLVAIHRHVRPIPEIPVGDYSCIQCKTLGRRCGRTSDEARICGPCARIGRRCLVKHLWTHDDDLVRSWEFAQGQFFGYDGLDYERRKWVKRLEQKGGRGEGFQPLPVWPAKKNSGETDQQNMPKRWQDYLKSI
ncbi:hypothetical protein FLONG3_10476 [Fusarium longipes]|uniref:Zn(2)-C6 fungal-type domain-containing protein n=1 Tax=Fusarium longipes TaxID=694270 RepID=A0A395RNA2_9HYPO|nr:hypothetical protein FLONG3_10476 [Fusarium longipes]